ncbi:hypothetical protein D0Z00_002139 [Geotrichum galactomycetum]|uniref:Uncharacterized protein n=1 Tax=Geotrichum galactomycetum TaxID=27317 RepID=A0ACB6V550_9ASCO|nr:hypothetical protein D0Z00_002139 [Geotrichum candidum]
MSNDLPPGGSRETKPEALSENITTDIISNNTKEGSEQTDIATAEPKVDLPTEVEHQKANGDSKTEQHKNGNSNGKAEPGAAIEDSKELTENDDVAPKAPEPLAVGTVVLAKVKGYSAWPGIILSDDMIPDDVLYLKPKSIKQRSKPNDKAPLDTTVYGVRFFVEISHVWSARENITVLTKEIINNYVNKQKGKRETKLLQAYKIALNPPSLSSIAQEIAERRQLEEEEDEEEEREASEEPVRTRSRGKKEPKSAATPKKELSTKNASTNKRKSRTSNAAANSETKERTLPLKRTKIEQAPEPVIVTDTDASLDSSATVAAHLPAPATSLAKDLKEHLETRTKLVRSIRHRLQRGFIGRTPLSEELSDLSNHLGRLEALPELELSVMRETKIKKLLSAILRTKDIPEESKYKFKSRITTVLAGWNKLSAEQADSSASATESLTPVPDSALNHTIADSTSSASISAQPSQPETVSASATATVS